MIAFKTLCRRPRRTIRLVRESSPTLVIALVAALLSVATASSLIVGQEPATDQKSSSDEKPSETTKSPTNGPIEKLFANHCQACHAGAKPKGDFSLASLTRDFADDANRRRWTEVAEQLRAGTMPPADRPRPAAGDVQAALDELGRRLAATKPARPDDSGKSTPRGRTVMRRLNQTEYVNTLRDLLDVDVDLRDLIPADPPASGFDNSAEAQHVSSYQMENYLKAAERALDAAIASRPRPNVVKRRFDIKNEKTVKPTGSVYRHVDDGVAIFSSWVSANIQVTLWQFSTRDRGKYRFRISGYGYQTDKPVTFHVMAGPLNAAAQQFLLGYYDVPADQPKVVEIVESLDPQQTIRIIADNLGAIPPDVEKVGAENYKGPGLVVQWVDIEGPLLDAWPPRSHRRLVGDLQQQPIPGDRSGRLEVVSQQPLADAERILRDFARRAIRRPATDAELRPFLARVRAKLDDDASFEEALRVGLRAILMSPNFLFLREPAGKLDDHALATRLSYFLWSSMPDDELFHLADEGKLAQPDVLRAQVERLLRDPKAAAFTENFAGQWLGLRSIDATMPDRMLYPEFDDVLKISSVRETTLFFEEVLKHDLSLTNFVASDFSMLNGPLAKHYGIPGVEGLEFRKVELPPDGRRGDVLTMASVLKVTANGTTTSPILRGAWVLDRILGTPPPKPSVDVEAVEPDIRGATTIREQLAKHRERSECANCHALIDPPGFALENYDVIGGWRERYRSIGQGDPVVVDGRKRRYLHGPPVDSADVLSDGRKFSDIGEFKRLLLADKDQLARALTEKLLAYATGAAPTPADRAEVRAIVDRVRPKHYGFRSLVHEIVQSPTFQSK